MGINVTVKVSDVSVASIWLISSLCFAGDCTTERQAVKTLRSEVLARKIYSGQSNYESNTILKEAAKLGQPLSLFLLASDDELPTSKRLEYIETAAALEDSNAISEMAYLIEDAKITRRESRYRFEILRNAVRVDSIHLRQLQQFALQSKERLHWISAIFWSVVIADVSKKSMGELQERANLKLLEAKLPKPQLNELRTRALLFRCERKSKVVEISESGKEWR
jgi:hypothetical protein